MRNLLLTLVFLCSDLSCNQEIFYGRIDQLEVISSFETDDCYISILKDITGKRVVAKCIKSTDHEEQALLVIDACASKIASYVSIAVNKVILLAPLKSKTAHVWQKGLTTLHEYAYGKSCEESLPWEGFTLQQRFREYGSSQWKKWGLLPEHRKGLSTKVIYTMSLHEDLAKIAALDTFLGNADRSLPNIYFDKQVGNFFGIDQAAAFRRPLAKIAIEQIEAISKEEMSIKQLKGMSVYLRTLKELHNKISPEKMQFLLFDLANKSKLLHIEDRMSAAKVNFSNNYAYVTKLIALLDGLLD